MNFDTLNSQLGGKEKKPSITATISSDENFITIKVPRKMDLQSLRTGEKSLFAAVQANPGNNVSLLVTDRETEKVLEIPCDRLVNFNLFATWAKHNIVKSPERVPAPAKS